MTAAEYTELKREDREFIDSLVQENKGRPGMLLTILESIQEKHPHKFLPEDFLEYLAVRTGIPTAQVYSVATFYSLFNLKPQGEHTVCICRGTACHTRGSMRLLDGVRLQLGLKETEEEGSADKMTGTTKDGKFTVRTVACFGQCALAPVAEVDHRILGHVNERALEREVEHLKKGRR